MIRVPNLKDGNIKWNKETIQKFRNIIYKRIKKYKWSRKYRK